MTRQAIHYRRSGFAAIVAISLIIMVGVSLATMGTFFAAEVKRTRSAAEDAQLRQLLIAGTVLAVKDVPQQVRAVALPDAINEAKLTLIPAQNGDTTTVRIVAVLRTRHVEQTIHLARDGERWKLVEIDPIDQSPASTQPSDRSTAASQRS